MALPHLISNGQNPNGTKLKDNFDYLDGLIIGGASIKTGSTFDQLAIYAALNPTVPFLCIPSDQDWFLLYCGKADRGNGGFITLADYTEIV